MLPLVCSEPAARYTARMIARPTRHVHPDLTPVVKDLLLTASRLLTGHRRRSFQGRVTDALLGGSARRAERRLGWNRDSVRQGQRENHTGILCLDDAFHARGNRPVEAKWPELAEDARALADAQAQADPQLRNAPAHTRLSAASLRRALVAEKGWDPAEVPAERTLNGVLNRPGYRLRAVAKTRPEKKRPSATPSSKTCAPPTRRRTPAGAGARA